MSDLLAGLCRAVCPDFVPTGPLRRGRKSEHLAGEVAGLPVLAKRANPDSAVWSWYAAREVALYRAFATRPLPVRTPRLVGASEQVLVIERLAGGPLAQRRRPAAQLAPRVIEPLLATLAALETARVTVPPVPPPERIRRQLRERLLEDPASDGAWISEGLVECGRSLLDEHTVRRARAALVDTPVVFAHGDVLLRNAIATEGGPVLVDWECAGKYLRDWDRALLWTQLSAGTRERVEASLGDDERRLRAFRALVVFALARELRFAGSFVAGRDAITQHVRDELAGACARLHA